MSAKRVFDLTTVFLTAPLWLPIIFLVAFLNMIANSGRVFYTQERGGYRNSTFKILKFSTMTNELDEKGVLLPDAKRITPLGSFLRSSSLDELPSLFNVISGDLSLVGPRPLIAEYLPLYDACQKRRHEVRPGVTGLAQVKGRNAISWEEKFRFDIWYVDNHTFWLDIKIILLTVKKIFIREGISESDNVTATKFTGGASQRESESAGN